MNFDNFLNALTKISQALGYNKKGKVEGFHSLIHEFMIPLYEEILKSPNYYTVSILENNVKFDEICNYLIRNVGPVLYEVYSAYFPWEIANSTIYSGLGSRSEKAYKEFLKEFDIWPAILTKTMAFQLWNSVIELRFETYKEMCERIWLKKRKGKHFTFSKFVDILMKIAYLYARESEDIPSECEIPSEIFIMLLEKLELSSGFLNLEKKTNKPHTSRTSLLPSKEVINLIRGAKEGDVQEVVAYIKEKNSKMIHKIKQQRYNEQKEIVPHNIPQIMHINSMDKDNFFTQNSWFGPKPAQIPSEAIEDPQNSTFSQFHMGLVQVFEAYCSLEDPSNSEFLSLSSFLNLMETAVQRNSNSNQVELSSQDLELMFLKAVNYSNSQQDTCRDHLNFSQFVFALELAAMKMYAYEEDAISRLITEYILPLGASGCGTQSMWQF
jgi:hypothetical protein